MNSKRRRQFYIDRIFQKKLLVVFLGINLLVVVTPIDANGVVIGKVAADQPARAHAASLKRP